MIVPSGIETTLFAIVGAALVISSFASTRAFLFLCGVTLPLMFPRLAVGIGLDWYKVVGPLALALLLVAQLRRTPTFQTRVPGMGWMIAYAVVVSVVWMLVEYNWLQRYRLAEAMGLGGGDAQTIYKMPVQLGSYLGQVACAFVIPAWASRPDHARAGILGYVAGCAASAMAGVISIALTGVGTINMSLQRALFVVGETDFTRLGGASGEPKFLGACLALVLSYGASQLLFGRARDMRKVLPWLFAGAAGLFLTFSTSAWASALGGFGVGVIMALQRWRQSRVLVVLLVLGAGVMLLGSFAIVGAILEARFADRLFGASAEVARQKDAYVFSALAESPWDAIFGYGLGGGDLAVIPYIDVNQLQYGRTPTPGITGVRLLADLGIVGLLILGLAARGWWRMLWARGERGFAAFVVMGLMAAMLCSMIALSGFFFLVGGVLALGNLRARETTVAVEEREAAMRSRMVPAGRGA